MESRTLTGHLLTPMFSYGENQKFPEFRATELKGMMRYLYRIACPAKLSVLKQDEAELFGGSTGDRKEQAGHASPVQLFLMQARQERFGELAWKLRVYCCMMKKDRDPYLIVYFKMSLN